LTILLIAVAVTTVLFDVDLEYDVALPAEKQVPDPAVEARYEQCYAEEDHEIHEKAFGTIDNPEVQKEFINSNRVRAERDCRERYPESMIIVREPFHFRLFTLRPRFW